jgi:pimeloyl-ACP methyl ester carboxylesterase
MSSAQVIADYEASGHRFEAAGVGSFVLEKGAGEAVACMHGVPTSSFLYRKVVAELAARGMRGVAFDLPGLGFADRPADFDYTWTGLGRFSVAAVDALGLERFHLVVHDIGGPIGFELAAAMPDRVLSMTLLNTLVEADTFRRPWSMEPFAIRGLRRLWLGSMSKPVFRAIMYLQGIKDRGSMTADEIGAYVDLLKRHDRGRAFLKIMSGFERTPEKTRLYEGAVRDCPYPVQVVWGVDDPALKYSVQGQQARRITGVSEVYTVPGKHFLQEDQAPAIAERVAALARG